MQLRPSQGILLLVSLAAVGGLLLWLPPMLLDHYERAQALGPPWSWLYLGAIGLGGALVFGTLGYVIYRVLRSTWRKKQERTAAEKNPSQLTAAEKQSQVDGNLAAVSDLASDPVVDPALKQQLATLVKNVETKRESEVLEIVAFGSISSGKSSLLNALAGSDVFSTDPRGGTTLVRQEVAWPGDDRVLLVDTPGLAEVEGEERLLVTAASARNADLVLLVVDGPLRAHEHSLLVRLQSMEKRVIVCLNKQDWYSPADRTKLAGQLASQLDGITTASDVVTVTSQAIERTRMRVLASGGEVEETYLQPADIDELAKRLVKVVSRDGKDLLLANLLLRSRGLVEEARERVRAALDKRAWQIVDQHMWGAAAAAAVSPMAIDLVLGSAISLKMVVELARVYRQPMDMSAASQLLAQLGKNLIAILGVNAAAPAVASAVASMLKTIPLAGTLAGGLLQGVVQALVTRWIGAVFIVYFRNEMQLPSGGLANVARREWDRLTTPAELWSLLTKAREYLSTQRQSKSDD